ncbi:MAG: hypothetical protein RLZZ58_2295 [Pseudomonadota bacterium]
MTLATLWRLARRDLSARIRGLRLLAVCLFLGVATLAAIGSLTRGITEELENRGQTVLGGDLQIAIAQRVASDAELAAFAREGALSQTVRLRAMAVSGDGARNVLAELKAVDAAYPLYGAFTLADGRAVSAPPPGQIYVSPSLVDKFGIDPAAKDVEVRFGTARLRVAGVIAGEPDRLGEGFALGPVAVINLKSLGDTALIQPGSLFESKYRLKLPASADPVAVAERLKSAFPDGGWEVTDRSNGAPGTRRFIERMGQFLTLVGLASLVIAGIGVGNGVSSYLEGKRAGIATLKVLGADSGSIFRIYVMQILAVAASAVIAGLVVGAVAPMAITALAGDVLPVQPGFAIHPAPLATSAAYGLLITLAFALPPLARTRHVPAAGLLRAVFDRGGRIDVPTAAAVVIAIAAVVALAAYSAREPLFSLGFMAAAAGLLALLTLIAWGIRLGAARLPRPKAPLLRLALTNLHRPGAQTGALVVALGLGLTLFVTMATIQTSLTNEIRSTVPARAPSFFVLDIPQVERDRFTALVKSKAPDATINMIPALRGSVTAFGGQRVADLTTLPEGAWVLRGDRGLTYSGALPRGSTVTAGAWWPTNYSGPPLVSLEEDVAASLSVGVGDSIAVNVLGVEVEAKIASLRRVEWDNFGLNYVIVFAPGAIDKAPHNMVATLTVPLASEAALGRAIPPAFPSSSMIEVRDVVSQITTLLTQMARAIAAAASIAILAGIAVLVGAIAASRARRVYDSVILKLLGSTRAQILGAQAIEYALLSAVLALLALGLGMGAGWYVITQLFDFDFAPDMVVVLATLFGGAAITFVFGMASSLPILAAKPAAALRSL